MSQFLEYPCPNCSSELNYDADKNDLKCLHCHTVFSIEVSNEIIQEKEIDTFKNASNLEAVVLKNVAYTCSKCGQKKELRQDVAFFECGNCGNNVINSSAFATRNVVPSAVIPFAISKDKAMQNFAEWIGKGFWNDSSLKQLSIADTLVGHYIPFWTFDANTCNNWSGQSGTYYYTSTQYTDANGRTQTKSVRKTRWEYKAGQFSEFFDDILICGNKDVTQDYMNRIYPFHLDDLKPLNDKYLLGWNAKAFDKDMNDCYVLSKNFINEKINQIAARKLADDTYCDLKVNSDFSSETYKHVLLPVWFCEYLFKNKKYYFIINGQTGKIDGDKPLSTPKIVTAIVLVIVLVILVVLFAN